MKRKLNIKFRAPRRASAILLDFPSVRAHIVFQFRLAHVRAGLAMLGTGKFSLRTASTALDICPTTLWTWLRKFQAGGMEALRPRWQKPRKASPQGEPCRLEIYFCP